MCRCRAFFSQPNYYYFSDQREKKFFSTFLLPPFVHKGCLTIRCIYTTVTAIMISRRRLFTLYTYIEHHLIKVRITTFVRLYIIIHIMYVPRYSQKIIYFYTESIKKFILFEKLHFHSNFIKHC